MDDGVIVLIAGALALAVLFGLVKAMEIRDDMRLMDMHLERLRRERRTARWSPAWARTGYKVAKASLGCLTLVASLLVVAPASAGPACDVTARAGDNPQALMDRAGPNKVLCFGSNVYRSAKSFIPYDGQTIVGGVFRYSGPNRSYSQHTHGFNLRSRGEVDNVTFRGTEVSGFDGRGITCARGTRADNVYLHHNGQNGFGCTAGFERNYGIVLTDSLIANNGSRDEEGHSAAGMKLMHMGRPGDPLGSAARISNVRFLDNIGNGAWLDISASAVVIEDSTMKGNTRHELRCEKCGGPVLFANNIIVDDSRPGFDGINVRNTGVITLLNNRVSGPGTVIHFIEASTPHGRMQRYPNLDPGSNSGFYFERVLLDGMRLIDGKVGGCSHPKVTCR